jgi:hypothetical protein
MNGGVDEPIDDMSVEQKCINYGLRNIQFNQGRY